MSKILILDDRPAICDLIQLRLVEEGHEVRTACDAEQAIDLGYLFEPDLFISDWNLKGEYDGLEVCEAIQHANSKTKMILMSGLPMHTLEARLERQSLFSTLRKPFSIEKLVELVNQALKQSDSTMPASFSTN